MNNFSKIILVLVLCLAIWFCYDKFGNGKIKFPEITQKPTDIQTDVDKPDINNPDDEKQEPQNPKTSEDSYIYVYMLTTDKAGGQFLKPVKRPLAPGKDRLTQAVTLLLSGPNNIEISEGIYSEIPDAARLISVTETSDKVTINLNNSFSLGGGSDSTYARMRQLIKTVLANTEKPVYMQIDGKTADVIGGEGITVTQPLSEKSLDE
ncbi:MAG: GerMN domain-containing protein [Candidatus Gastranaerophilales bacterium]|nr:GerMN domain-containing protein [Candidatus Gastranaerophilales bacterium]